MRARIDRRRLLCRVHRARSDDEIRDLLHRADRIEARIRAECDL